MRTVILLPALCGALAAQEAIDVGDRRQLLFDGRFLASKQGIEFRVHPPRKTGEFILRSERHGDIGGYSSVVEDNGTYHLYYLGESGAAYLRSADGIHWEKPPLRLGGPEGKESNLALGSGVGGLKGSPHGIHVFLDPTAPSSERFRLITNPEEFDSFLQVYSSPDGIHWRHTHRNVLTFRTDTKPHHLDSPNVVFWDTRIRKYVAYVRRNLRERNSQARTVARAESDDLSKFGRIEDTTVVMQAHGEDLHPGWPDPKRGGIAAVLDAYTNGTVQYPWAQDAYFMFPTLYYHYGPWNAEFRDDVPVNAGALDVRFASSRDGLRFDLNRDEPFVGLGVRGSFDSMRTYITNGLVPARNGHEMYMYYMGTNETHGWNRDDRNNRLLIGAGLGPTPEMRAISRLVLRRDGFVSVRAGMGGGEFTTPPLKFQGGQLVLNIDTSASGEAQVEIQDAAGRPIEGFALADCDLIHSANEIDRVVMWKRASDLAKLAGRTVRLRVRMRDTHLYAFQFRFRSNV